MKTLFRTMSLLTLAIVGLAAKPAQAQVSIGVATPGFALGIGPGAGYVAAGGVYPGYPVVAPPIYAPRPIVVAPPIYGRPFYPGYVRGPVYGPRYAPGPPRYYRR